MGYDGSYYGSRAPKGKARIEAALRNEGMMIGSPNEYGCALDAAIVGSTVYVLYHDNRRNIDTCIVMLTFFEKKSGFFFTKVVDEFMSPYETKCPKRILNKLSPLDDELDPSGWAREWRERCRATPAKSELSKLPYGTVIRLNNPEQTVLLVCRPRGRRMYLNPIEMVKASPKVIEHYGYEVLKGDKV